MAKAENEPQAVKLHDTLQALEGVLPADQLELASRALNQMVESKKVEKEKRNRFELISGIVLDYEKVIDNPDLAHTDGALMYSSAKYLSTARDGLVPKELDNASRLYAAYCLMSNPEYAEDYARKPAMELIEDSGVNTEELHALLQAYRGGELPTLEEMLEREEFYGEYYMEFLPHPGLIEKIKEGLFYLGYEELYNSLKPSDDEED